MHTTKKARFLNWQKDRIPQEIPNMITADLVEKYLKKVEFSQIKLDAQDINPSLAFQKIQGQVYWKRGVLLYTILDVEEALELLTSKREKEILGELKKVLVLSYGDYSKQPVEKINSSLKYLAAFLQINPQDFSNQKKAKELYSIFYLSLCVTHFSLNKPAYAVD